MAQYNHTFEIRLKVIERAVVEEEAIDVRLCNCLRDTTAVIATDYYVESIDLNRQG